MELLLLSSTALSHTQLSHFLGAWGQTQPLPWKTGSLGGKTTGQPSTGQEAGGESGVEGRRTMQAWTTSSPGRGQSVYPQSCHARGHHTHGLPLRPSPPPGVLPAPTSSMPSQGSFKPQIRPRPPQPEPLLTFAGQFPHTSTHLVGTRALLFPHSDPPGPHSAHGLLRKPQGSQMRF